VIQRWEGWGLGAAPSDFSQLLLTGGLRSESKIVSLLFPDASPRPLIALKTPRTPEGVSAVRREAEILRGLVGRVEPETLRGIPRFLFVEEFGGATVLGETAFTGVPLLSAWTDQTYDTLALKASACLAELGGQRALYVPAPLHPRELAATVDDFVQGITLVVRGIDLLASTGRQIQLARLLGREEPPAFFHHGLIMKPPASAEGSGGRAQKLSKSDGDTGIRDLRARGWTASQVIAAALAAVAP